MILWIWVNSFFWSTAPLAGWSRISYEPTKLSCTVDIMHPNISYKTYIISCFVWCYVFPILIMIYCHIRKRDEYFLVSEERKGYKVTFKNKSIYGTINTEPKKFNLIFFLFLKKLIILCLLFILQWTPYCIEYLWPLFDDPNNIPLRLSAAAPVFAKLSVVLNPIVYLSD